MSEGFTAGWLRLREPYDARARNLEVLGRLVAWRMGRGQMRVVDLGSGTGTNLRRTAPELGGEQTWILVEWDPALIASGESQLVDANVAWRYRRLDLARELERVADEPCDLITASALLDLVSADWLDRLVALRQRCGAALYMTLTYVGRTCWSPVDPFDTAAAALVDRHQFTDKGFGLALGPAASHALQARLLPAEGRLFVGASNWGLGPQDREIQVSLLEGYVSAATTVCAAHAHEPRTWADRRLRLMDRGLSSLEVAHEDLLLLPPSAEPAKY